MKNKNLILLLLLATCWGPSFLFIKIAVEELSPLMIAGLRVALGALVLNAIRLFQGLHFPKKWSFWRDILFTGFFAQALPFTLINWGQQYIDSSLASLLNGLTPLSTIFLAHIMLADEKMTAKKVIGVTLGLIGLLILVAPDLLKGATASTLGILSVSIAAFSYGIALVYAKKHFANLKPLVAPSAQLLTVSLFLLPVAFFSGNQPLVFPSWITVSSVFMLGTFGTGIAFLVYFNLLQSAGAGYVSSSTFILPIYGIVLGVVFLDETITVWMLLGATVILTGVAVANGIRLPKPKSLNNLDVAAFSKVR